jgi:DNA (cytosine-5)-methyltransferase 1
VRLGELFAGVAGFGLGFEAAGFETAWQVEVDPWCLRVLARHWPDVERHGDVRHVDGADLGPVDVITFGSPCTDMSVAGRRVGLAGGESVLFFEAARIIGEMRDATGGRFPAWAVWENVPGAFSSNDGADFATVIDTLAERGAVELEWRTVDARFFGVPQRRRRVFLLAGFNPRGDGAPEVLSDPPGLRRDPEAVGAAWEAVAGSLGGGSGSRGWACDTDRMTFVPVEGHPVGVEEIVGQALSAKWSKSTSGPADRDQVVILVPGGPGGAYGLSENQRGEVRLTGQSRQLTAGGGKPGQGYPAVFSIFPEHGQGADLRAIETDLAPSVSATDGAKRTERGARIVQSLAVRRLTPRECERLMGWPDDHTRWAADGRQVPDSQRYRMCGNGVVAPVAEWVARRLIARGF